MNNTLRRGRGRRRGPEPHKSWRGLSQFSAVSSWQRSPTWPTPAAPAPSGEDGDLFPLTSPTAQTCDGTPLKIRPKNAELLGRNKRTLSTGRANSEEVAAALDGVLPCEFEVDVVPPPGGISRGVLLQPSQTPAFEPSDGSGSLPSSWDHVPESSSHETAPVLTFVRGAPRTVRPSPAVLAVTCAAGKSDVTANAQVELAEGENRWEMEQSNWEI